MFPTVYKKYVSLHNLLGNMWKHRQEVMGRYFVCQILKYESRWPGAVPQPFRLDLIRLCELDLIRLDETSLDYIRLN